MPCLNRRFWRLSAYALAALVSGCTAPTTEPDFSPFIDVWTADPPPKRGQPVDYLILQGDFSVCEFTVRGPQDATYSGGEYTLTPNRLTLTFTREKSTRTEVYAIEFYRRGELRLTDVGSGGQGRAVVLKHSKEYSSCTDAQTLFGKQLKIR